MKLKPEKAEILASLYAERNSPLGQVLQKYLTLRIQEVREENDEANGDSLFRNQGKIAELKVLLEAMERGGPMMRQ